MSAVTRNITESLTTQFSEHGSVPGKASSNVCCHVYLSMSVCCICYLLLLYDIT